MTWCEEFDLKLQFCFWIYPGSSVGINVNVKTKGLSEVEEETCKGTEGKLHVTKRGVDDIPTCLCALCLLLNRSAVPWLPGTLRYMCSFC